MFITNFITYFVLQSNRNDVKNKLPKTQNLTARSKAQQRNVKSLALTPAEHEQLKAFGEETDTQAQKATKLGVTREVYLRMRLSGTGRGDYVVKVREALRTLSVAQTNSAKTA